MARNRVNACLGKKCYPDWIAAHNALVRTVERDKKRDRYTGSMREYKCPYGKHFHIGHRKKKKSAA